MIKFYYHTSPNPAKVALYLEEAGLAYEPIPVDTRRGDQHSPAYLALNPNAKTPTIVDGDTVVFDSTAILLYLSEICGKFLPANAPAARAPMHSWLLFVASGIGPYCGQAVHFKHFVPKPDAYALNRYDFEAWRHWGIVDTHLTKCPYMLGEAYSLVDMAVWGWARAVPRILGSGAWEKLPNVARLFQEINDRPAAKRVESLMTRHAFKTEVDDEARTFLFPQNARLIPPGVEARS
jgi:GST-like protein